MSFPGVTVPQAQAGKAAAAGSLLTGIGGMVNPVAGILSGIGGISSMFGDGGSGMEVSKAVSGGTFTTGEFGSGKSETLTTVAVIAAIVLGFVLIFKGKK